MNDLTPGSEPAIKEAFRLLFGVVPEVREGLDGRFVARVEINGEIIEDSSSVREGALWLLLYCCMTPIG